jgi:LAO/AO transport system kinase
MSYVPSRELVGRVANGEIPAIARLISRAEAGVPEARDALADIYQRAGRAHVIGLTGVPGSGKSTLVSALTARLRAGGSKVGIVAIDPSSPYSGGSILGDRIRMTDLINDPGVYIRSMATRGVMGGLARATMDAVDILDVGGFDTVIIETVGVGQDEVEIAKASDTTVVLSAPGLGDEIQAIKAGMLEIADIHVVSKCDRSDANRTLMDLKQMLTLGAMIAKKPEWRVPVIGVSAYTGSGFDELMGALDRHRNIALHMEAGRRRRVAIARFRLAKTAENLLLERFARASALLTLDFAERLQRHDGDPYSLANELLAAFFGKDNDEERDRPESRRRPARGTA